jgi:hypothetical protein
VCETREGCIVVECERSLCASPRLKAGNMVRSFGFRQEWGLFLIVWRRASKSSFSQRFFTKDRASEKATATPRHRTQPLSMSLL